jgi:hypothetical protein
VKGQSLVKERISLSERGIITLTGSQKPCYFLRRVNFEQEKCMMKIKHLTSFLATLLLAASPLLAANNQVDKGKPPADGASAPRLMVFRNCTLDWVGAKNGTAPLADADFQEPTDKTWGGCPYRVLTPHLANGSFYVGHLVKVESRELPPDWDWHCTYQVIEPQVVAANVQGKKEGFVTCRIFDLVEDKRQE